jgi:hypothetical protein
VNAGDVGAIADNWLIADVNLVGQTQKPDDANLLGWWKLDGDANDSSGNGHDGTIEHFRYYWVIGYDDVNLAIRIAGNPARILVPDSANLRPTEKLSVCAWVHYSEEQPYNSRVVVKGADNRESYALEVDDEDRYTFYVRDANLMDKDDYWKRDVNTSVWRHDWIHLAGTCDGNTVKCYVNGEFRESKAIDDPNFLVSQDVNGLAIGNLADANEQKRENAFIGAIDDVRVYDYALSQGEVVWLASDGTGYVPLTAPFNLYDKEAADEQIINFRDFAALFESWLEERKWPPLE